MALGGLLFLVFAYRIRLGMYDLLYSPRGMIFGAGYTDVHATLPVLRADSSFACLTAVSFVAGAKLGRLRPALYSLGTARGGGHAGRIDLPRDRAALCGGPQ